MKITPKYKELIKENQEIIIKNILNYLKDYSVQNNLVRLVDEYWTKDIIINNIDGNVVKPNNLLKYLVSKFPNVNKDFVKQIMIDWFSGNLSFDKPFLTKNLPI